MVDPKKEVIIKKKGKKLFSIKDDGVAENSNTSLNENVIINDILQFGHKNIEKFGTLVSVQNLYTELIKKYFAIKIKTINKILKNMHKKKVIRLLKLNKFFEIIQYTPFELNPFMIKILKIAAENPIISVEEISQKIDLSIFEIEQLLDILITKKIAKIQENALSGKRYIFPGLINKA